MEKKPVEPVPRGERTSALEAVLKLREKPAANDTGPRYLVKMKPQKEPTRENSETPVRLVPRTADPEAIRRALSGQASRAEEAIRGWKSDPAIRAQFPNFIDYYDHLAGEATTAPVAPEERRKSEPGSDAERGEAAIAAGKAKIIGRTVVMVQHPGGKGTV